MLIHLLAETPSKVVPIRAIVEPMHRLVPIDTSQKPSFTADDVLMIDFDLRNEASVARVREFLRKAGKLRHKIFVVDKKSHSLIVQAHALEASGTISRPLDRDEVLRQLLRLDIATPPSDRQAPASGDLSDSAAIFASMFSTILNGTPIELADAKRATEQIINSVSQRGLTTWLDDVRKHHEGTFQHCLLVSGVATSFAINLGFASADVYRLGLAATLHDVGKANIPLAILDKPARLDAEEERIMRVHPVYGFDALKAVPGIDAEVLDAVRHHHEYLDGTGYPDALTAPAIADVVRLLTISDIFAALIESRPYKATMSRAKAYDILSEMSGKLEPALVRAFKPIALAA
jgi:putative nucleotidyltransferase with HDIG domain